VEKNGARGFAHWKISRTALGLLSQGMTPQKIAWTLALGLSLGVFPVLGSTTLLCALAAFVFKLNLPLIQLVNYLVYPLQFLLLLPFLRLGARLFGAGSVPWTLSQMVQMIHRDPGGAIARFWVLTWEGIGAWCLTALPVAFLLFLLFHFLLRQAGKVSVKHA
jgi:uncharacterized protein (DUF2062 family)